MARDGAALSRPQRGGIPAASPLRDNTPRESGARVE
jgi:hypothetical protein